MSTERFSTNSPEWAAVALTLGGRLIDTREVSNKVLFTFEGCPPDLQFKICNTDAKVSVLQFLDSLRSVYDVIWQAKRARAGGRA